MMIEEFLAYERKVKNLSENTIKVYGDDLKAFAKYLLAQGQETRWSEVHKRTIDGYLAYCHDAGEKPATIRRRLASIRALYNYFRKQGLLEANPAQFCESPKLPKSLPNTVDEEAVEAYIGNERKPKVMRLMVALFYETGIRISELTSLTTWDIDWQERSLRITGKGLKSRIVYYGELTAELLQAYTQGRQGQVFQGSDQCHREIRWQIWQAFHKDATNGKASPHTIRHTYATKMLQQGMPLHSLQMLLGHEQVETTRNYARLTNVEVKRDYERAMTNGGA